MNYWIGSILKLKATRATENDEEKGNNIEFAYSGELRKQQIQKTRCESPNLCIFRTELIEIWTGVSLMCLFFCCFVCVLFSSSEKNYVFFSLPNSVVIVEFFFVFWWWCSECVWVCVVVFVFVCEARMHIVAGNQPLGQLKPLIFVFNERRILPEWIQMCFANMRKNNNRKNHQHISSLLNAHETRPSPQWSLTNEIEPYKKLKKNTHKFYGIWCAW